MVDPGGFDRITVRQGKNLVQAKVTAIYPDQGAMLLELAKELPDGKVLNFVPADKSPKFAFSRIMELGRWVCRLSKFDPAPAEQLFEGSSTSRRNPGNALIVNSSGKPVALLGNNNELTGNLQWDLPWEKWRKLPVKEYEIMRLQLMARLQKCVVPATIYLNEWKLTRREKLNGTIPNREFYSYVFKLPDGRVFMPIHSNPEQNGRIEKVVVHLPQGKVTTQVSKVMKYFGGMFLEWKPEWNLPPIANHFASMPKEMGNMVWCVDVNVYSNMLNIVVKNDALGAVLRTFQNVWSGSGIKKGYPELLFSLSGNLLGVNLNVRAVNYQRFWSFVDAGEIAFMERRKGWIVPFKKLCNQPDSIGYLGIEYQAMNQELARSMNISHLTNYGADGLLITHVYKDSPAAKMRLKNGDVLLKLIVPQGGAPIRLTAKKFAVPQGQQFPWDKLDNVPEQYFSEIPEPWNGVKNPLTEQLTDIGIGKKLILISVSGGKLQHRIFAIENAPVYFEIAPRYRSAALGVEVRDITFELQRYFRMQKNPCGVIIAEVAAGSPASTAGLRPFEIITAVNDKPVHSAAEFKSLVASLPEVRLTVRRLAMERIVPVKAANGPRR